jgi:hypothetical protein
MKLEDKLYLLKFNWDEQSHIDIVDQDVCPVPGQAVHYCLPGRGIPVGRGTTEDGGLVRKLH